MKYSFLFLRKDRIDCFISLFWGFCHDDSKTIHHTMNMGIYTYIRHIIEDRENYLGRFDANTWKSLQEFEFIGNASIVFTGKTRSSFLYVSWFISIKIHISKMWLDGFKREIFYISCFPNQCKKWWCNSINLLISCLCREDNSTEKLKWRFVIELYFLSSIELYEYTEDVTEIRICEQNY